MIEEKKDSMEQLFRGIFLWVKQYKKDYSLFCNRKK